MIKKKCPNKFKTTNKGNRLWSAAKNKRQLVFIILFKSTNVQINLKFSHKF